jgi:phosphoglycolate phosphatase-like HAD superfamily hydrolase
LAVEKVATKLKKKPAAAKMRSLPTMPKLAMIIKDSSSPPRRRQTAAAAAAAAKFQANIQFTRRVVSVLLSLALLLVLFTPTCCLAFTTTLITFDVDGTLVRGKGKDADESAHARAFSYACGKVLGSKMKNAANKKHHVVVKPVAQALPRHLFHGSTDGLILCRLAKAELGVDQVSESELREMMQCMYEYIAVLDDEQVAKGIEILPGVLDHLTTLGQLQKEQQQQQQQNMKIACGLVTGNVEGIARRKMRAVGVLDTHALSAPAADQVATTAQQWPGVQDIAFLGGFGSDYCSRSIIDFSRNYLDRAEQIAICARRACQESTLSTLTDYDRSSLSRVVHVGDAPADVLAAKAYSQFLTTTTTTNSNNNNSKNHHNNVCVGVVAVATGSYSAEQLRQAAGEPVPGRWEPVILEKGMADVNFLQACGLQY